MTSLDHKIKTLTMIRNFNKVVIWGHPLYSHTHSFIHASFYKAFKSMGYETYWLSNSDDVSQMDFSNSLFLTEGQADSKIPLVKDSYYILHNAEIDKYVNSGCKCLVIQTYKGSERLKYPNTEEINECSVIHRSGTIDCLFMAWATDLLPHEIDLSLAKNQTSTKNFFWAGTIGGGDSVFENGSTLQPFINKCTQAGFDIQIIDPWNKAVSFNENLDFVNSAYLAPAIQGKWQVETGYIPCRIFKNISYGHFGYTNSSYVNQVFANELVYDNDSERLFEKAIDKKNDPAHVEQLKYLMNEVKTKHTYINRIETILKNLP